MKVSNVIVKLSESDLLGMMEQEVKQDDLKIESIKIDNFLNVKGFIKKKIKFGFKASIAFIGAKDNVLSLKIQKIKVGFLPIPNALISGVLSKAISKMNNVGLAYKEGSLQLDFNKLSRLIPQIDFEINGIYLFNNNMEVEISKIVLDENKEILTMDELKERIISGEDITNQKKEVALLSSDNSENNIDSIDKNVDNRSNSNDSSQYYKIRENIENKTPKKLEKVLKYAFVIPDLIVLLYRLLKDERVNTKTKASIVGVIAYLALPFDIIPDSIPIIGQIDDIVIILPVIKKIFNELDKEIIEDNWQGDYDIIEKVKEVSAIVTRFIGEKKAFQIAGAIILSGKKYRKKKRKKRNKV
ncbi:YkvA family protein [Clostridium sp. DL1XJH146]